MTTAPKQGERWVTATALQALARCGLKAGARFTAAELTTWCPTFKGSQRTNATTRLCALGFVKHSVEVTKGQRADVYSITAEGAAAIAAAGLGQVRKSGPKGTRKPNPLKADSLLARTWRLVRSRRIVDSDSLATTLCDAGDQVFSTVQANVRKYLKRWEDLGAFEVAVRRVNASGHSNGCKRYVLRDAFDKPDPPQRQEQRQGAAA